MERFQINVRKIGQNVYSVEIGPINGEPINKNRYFGVYEVDGHFTVSAPLRYVDSSESYCRRVAHTSEEANKKLGEEIREHVSALWEDHYRRGIEKVLDSTGEGILDGWKKPILMPDD